GYCVGLIAPAGLAGVRRTGAAHGQLRYVAPMGSGLRLGPCGLQQALLPEMLPGLVLGQVGLELAVVTQGNAALRSRHLEERQTYARHLALVSAAPALVNDLHLRHGKEVVLPHGPEHVLL